MNDVFPVAGALQTFPIGTTTAQLPASPGEWIYVSISVPWTNTADGAHVIQIVAAPPFAQPTSNDEATRSIFVGTPPADLDIAKSVDLLVDADGNSVVSPGDTLRYTIRFDNTGGTNVSGAVIFDDYSEVLLEEPFGLSRPGTIAGGKITWNLGTIGAESYGELIYDVRIKPPGEFPREVRSISNIATLDTEQTAPIAATATVDVVTNSPPVAHAGGPYLIFEGDVLTLDASGSSDPDNNALTYTWDLNGDGDFGDATGVNPTLAWAELIALGISDGPHAAYPPRVRVDDQQGGVTVSPEAFLTLTNTAPTPAIGGAPASSPEGTAITLTASATDPSPADTAAGFTYSWMVTASNGQMIADGSGATFTFVPRDNGTYRLR